MSRAQHTGGTSKEESTLSDDQTPIEETPEPVSEPEQVAEPAPDIAEREAAIAKRERELQQGFDRIARERRELEQRATPPAEEPDVALDPEAEKALDAWAAKKLGPQLKQFEVYQQSVAQRELEKFAKANDLDPEEVGQTVLDNNLLRDLTPQGIASALDSAQRIIKAAKFDPAAEEQRIREKVLAELAEQGAVVAGVPKPTTRGDSSLKGSWEAARDDDSLSAEERYRLANEHLERR